MLADGAGAAGDEVPAAGVVAGALGEEVALGEGVGVGLGVGADDVDGVAEGDGRCDLAWPGG